MGHCRHPGHPCTVDVDAAALEQGATVAENRDHLATLVRAQSAEMEPWEAAELHLLEQAFRERLAALNVAVTPDVAVALMATATLLGNAVPEWGGDARCALGEVAQLGLRLLEEEPTQS